MLRSRLILTLSLRHFFNREKKGSHHLRGAAIGIGIAVIPVIIVLIAGNGLVEGITRRYQELSSGQIQIRGVRDPEEMEDFIASAAELDGIKYIGEFYEQYGLLSDASGNAGAVIRGLPSDVYSRDEGFRSFLSITGGVFSLEHEKDLMVSRHLAEQLNISPGDEVRLIISRKFGRRTLYRPTKFVVSGIFSTGYYELDTSTVYVSSDKVRKLFGNDTPGYISIKTAPESVQEIISELTGIIGDRGTIMPWYAVNNSMYENFSSTKSSLMIIMLLIVAIAGLSVSSSVYMLVMEQREEIAFLKAVGLNNSMISRVFLVSGGLTGFIGGGLGIFFGLMIGIQINPVLRGLETAINYVLKTVRYMTAMEYNGTDISIVGGDFYLDQIPVIIHYREILLVFAVGISVSIAGALIPSIKASRIPPIDLISKK